jgi:methionyl-tRNA formyltransferase
MIPPSFQGAAPLHHTLLCNEENIGLTLQTLDPDKFDHGQILAQSEYPGFRHSCSNVPELMAVVSPKGAEMLVNGLRDLVYVSPRQDVGWYSTKGSIQPIRRAPKITPEDRHIDWGTWTAERILRTHRVIGPLWNITGAWEQGKPRRKRIIWSSGFDKSTGSMDSSTQPGHPVVNGHQSDVKSILIKTCDGHTLQVFNVKIEGGISAPASQEIQKLGFMSHFT